MWKLQNFSVTQILREIKVGEFWGSKFAIFKMYLNALNFDFHDIFHSSEADFYQSNRFRDPKMAKVEVLELICS